MCRAPSHQQKGRTQSSESTGIFLALPDERALVTAGKPLSGAVDRFHLACHLDLGLAFLDRQRSFRTRQRSAILSHRFSRTRWRGLRMNPGTTQSAQDKNQNSHGQLLTVAGQASRYPPTQNQEQPALLAFGPCFQSGKWYHSAPPASSQSGFQPIRAHALPAGNLLPYHNWMLLIAVSCFPRVNNDLRHENCVHQSSQQRPGKPRQRRRNNGASSG